MRTVSFLGLDWVESADRGSAAGGNGVIFGGTRRIGAAGVRAGRTLLTTGCSPPFPEGDVLSGRGGTAIRTGSFFGSVMGGLTARKNGIKGRALSLANCRIVGRFC